MTAEVTSDNVVGYQKVNFNSGLTIIGQQFVGIGSDAANIQSIVGTAMNADGGDFVRIWDGSKYFDYLYCPGDTLDLLGDGSDVWATEDGEPVDVDVPAGTGMWISANDAATLSFSGEVGTHTVVEFFSGLNLICAPQPVDIVLQDVKGTGMNEDGGDFIRLWNGSQYSDYLYCPGDTLDLLGDGSDVWATEDGEPVDVIIPAGIGFWLSANGDGTLIFPNALAL